MSSRGVERVRVRLLLIAVAVAATQVMSLAPVQAVPFEWRASGLAATELNDVASGAAGRSYVTGTYRRGDDEWLLLTAAVDRDGRTVWRRTWRPRPGTAGCDFNPAPGGEAITVAGGRVFVAGILGGSCETMAWFVRAYTTTGSFLWQAVQPGWRTGSTCNAIHSVAADATQLIVAAQAGGCGADASREGSLQAYTLTGAPRWHRDVEVPAVSATNYDIVSDVAIADDGAVYVTGGVERLGQVGIGDAFDYEFFLQKLTGAGSVVWTKVRWHLDRDWDMGTSVDTQGKWIAVGSTWYLPGHPENAQVTFFTRTGARRFIYGFRVPPGGYSIGADLVFASSAGRLYVLTGGRTWLRLSALDAQYRSGGLSGWPVTWDRQLAWLAGWGVYPEGVAADDGGAFVVASILDPDDMLRGRLWRFRA